MHAQTCYAVYCPKELCLNVLVLNVAMRGCTVFNIKHLISSRQCSLLLTACVI